MDKPGLTLLGAGVVASAGTRVYDHKIYDHVSQHGFILGHKESERFGKIGNGFLGVTIATTQIYFDTDNGLRTARAMLLTTTSHLSIAALARRNRPGNRQDFLPFPSSFPSGHTSNAFALAGSLAYSYGWAAGVPAYLVATGIGVSRIREGRHWMSDVVGGAFLGTFWARASFKTPTQRDDSTWYPTPVGDGLMVTWTKVF